MRCDRPVLRLACAAILAAAAATPAVAAETLEVSVPPEPVAVGDRVPVTVTAPAGPRSWGAPQVAAGDGTAWAAVGEPRELGPGRWRLVLVPLRTGTLPLPGIRVRDASGAEAVAPAGSATVTVASVLPPGTRPPEPAPLRDPVGVQGPPWEWLPPVLALLLPLALLAWFLLRRRRRRAGSGAGAAAELPPLEELLRALDELAAALGRTPAPASCDRLAAAVRRYLERRLGEPAREMTSFELFRLARRLGWPAPQQAALRRVLETADRVRFARARIPEAELRAAVETARDLGRALELRLAPEEAAPEEVA